MVIQKEGQFLGVQWRNDISESTGFYLTTASLFRFQSSRSCSYWHTTDTVLKRNSVPVAGKLVKSFWILVSYCSNVSKSGYAISWDFSHLDCRSVEQNWSYEDRPKFQGLSNIQGAVNTDLAWMRLHGCIFGSRAINGACNTDSHHRNPKEARPYHLAQRLAGNIATCLHTTCKASQMTMSCSNPLPHATGKAVLVEQLWVSWSVVGLAALQRKLSSHGWNLGQPVKPQILLAHSFSRSVPCQATTHCFSRILPMLKHVPQPKRQDLRASRVLTLPLRDGELRGRASAPCCSRDM